MMSIENKPTVILASASPRRQALFSRIVPAFLVCAMDVDETIPEGMPPQEAVAMLARKKAMAAAKAHENAFIVGADTMVALKTRLLGKPRDEKDAADMLHLLSGKIHQVYTGLCVITPEGDCFEDVACTSVQFGKLTKEEIESYVATAEPMGKAGAYAIQGGAGVFVRGIKGCYYNVVGLPLYQVKRLLRLAGAVN